MAGLDLPLVLIFAAVLAVTLGLGLAITPSDSGRIERRVARVRSGMPEERAAASPGTTVSVRRRQASSLFGGLGHALRHLIPRAATLRQTIERAGLQLSVSDYVLLSAGFGMSLALLSRLLLGAPPLLAVAIGLIAATGVPKLVTSRMIAQRRQQFLARFPDAVDLIVRGVRSGLPVAEAIHNAGSEIPGRVGEVFGEITGNLRVGMTLDEALWLVARRIQIEEFKFFVISLAVQQETGGNLAEILSNLSQLMRRREQVKLKIRALSSEARASAAIIGALPFVMFGVIFTINPSYLMVLFTDPRGWLLLVVGFLSLGTGIAVMVKMIRLEI